MKCLVCKDGLVIHTRLGEDYNDSYEIKWTRGGTHEQLDLAVSTQTEWPYETGGADQVRINNILVYKMDPRSERNAWGNILIAHFLDDPATGTNLIDLVTEGGRCGYLLEKVSWTSDDRAGMVSYDYTSPSYGHSHVTFSKVEGIWFPTEFATTKSASDKMYVVGTIDETVGTAGFTGIQSVMKIEYRDGLPVSIVRNETFSRESDQGVDTKVLTFSELRSGDVTCEESRRFALPTPDGVDVVQLDPELAKLKFTTENGKIVREIDREGVRTGQSASFSSSGSMLLILNVVIFTVIGAVVLYRLSMKRKDG